MKFSSCLKIKLNALRRSKLVADTSTFDMSRFRENNWLGPVGIPPGVEPGASLRVWTSWLTSLSVMRFTTERKRF